MFDSYIQLKRLIEKLLIVSFGIGYFELISPAIIKKIREIDYLEIHKIYTFWKTRISVIKLIN